MPTIAEEPPNPPRAEPHTAEERQAEQHTVEPHQHRQIAESFGTDPERYDRTRPRYPDALIERIVAASPGPYLLEVGCGTGTATRQFSVHPRNHAARFSRIELDWTACSFSETARWKNDDASRLEPFSDVARFFVTLEISSQ